jgi:hypothetical protein
MAKFNLTAERLRTLLDYDSETGLFTRKRTSGGRRIGQPSDGEWPQYEIDHIDQDPTNNLITNLRDISHSANGQNVTAWSHNSSGCKDVVRLAWIKGKGVGKPFRVRIKLGGKEVYAKSFKTLEEAAADVIAARAIYHPYAPK